MEGSAPDLGEPAPDVGEVTEELYAEFRARETERIRRAAIARPQILLATTDPNIGIG